MSSVSYFLYQKDERAKYVELLTGLYSELKFSRIGTLVALQISDSAGAFAAHTWGLNSWVDSSGS
jgi:hypothetical protein